MRPVMQTKRGGGDVPPEERGDCVAACMASILGLPITEIENCHGEGWWNRLQASLDRHGFCAALLDMRWSPPPTFWIASLPSLNLGPEPSGKIALHTVVAHGYDLVHDPAIGTRRYDEAKWAAAWNEGKVEEGWVLLPRDRGPVLPPAGAAQ